MQDGGEGGVGDVTLTLNGTSFDGSTVSRTSVTDVTGVYLFNLPPGNYTVSITVPSGYVLTIPGNGTNDIRDSDFSPSIKSTGLITLHVGEQLTYVDAGLVRAGGFFLASFSSARDCTQHCDRATNNCMLVMVAMGFTLQGALCHFTLVSCLQVGLGRSSGALTQVLAC